MTPRYSTTRASSTVVRSSLAVQPKLKAIQTANSASAAIGMRVRRGGLRRGSRPHAKPAPITHQIASAFCSWTTLSYDPPLSA